MKKKTVAILLAIIVLAGGSTAFGFMVASHMHRAAMKAESASMLTKAENSAKAKRVENSQETIESRITVGAAGGDLRQLMRARGYYEDDIIMAMAKLIDVSIFYDMTQEEYDYIVSLVRLGYDPEKLCAIYQFLQMTPDGISYMKNIYDTAGEDKSGKFWIENAYETLKGTSFTSLKLDEINYYVENDISIEDIASSYEMSLNGTKNIHEILDMKIQGNSWAQISEKVYGTDEIDAEKFDADTDLQTIMRVVNIARRVGEKPKNITQKGYRLQNFINEQAIEKIQKKNEKIQNLWTVLDISPYNEQKFKEIIKSQVKGLDDSTVDELLDEGCRVKDIIGAQKGEKTEKAEMINSIISREAEVKRQ